MSGYDLIVGLEVHIQLNTSSKAFCSDDNVFTTEANRNVGPVSLALPGTLPYANEQQVQKAVKLGLAIGAEINKYCYFDRKNYFYPDLPKGYQLTQDYEPICRGGSVTLENGREIRINRIHMEEDAGKSIHHIDSTDTMLDYNRAGVPLLELVTEPDFRSAEEVAEFILYLRQLVRYLDVSDAVMQEGSLRCDVNLSLRREGTTAYGTRCEIKNLNSANNARKAVELEYIRQLKLTSEGLTIKQQTLDFSVETGKLSVLRTKEDAHDYRYFPDPDLPPLVLSDKVIEEVKQGLGVLPKEMKAILIQDYELTEYNAAQLAEYKLIAEDFIRWCAVSEHIDPKLIANFMINKVIPHRRTETHELNEYPLTDNQVLDFLRLIQEEKISASSAYQSLLPALLDKGGDPAELAKELDIIQDADSEDVEQLVIEMINAFPDKVKTYKKGKKGLFGFFMGEAMKRLQGKANPQTLKAVLEKHLNS